MRSTALQLSSAAPDEMLARLSQFTQADLDQGVKIVKHMQGFRNQQQKEREKEEDRQLQQYESVIARPLIQDVLRCIPKLDG
eukprot:7492142-Pyramimonas_sp.AAC.1